MSNSSISNSTTLPNLTNNYLYIGMGTAVLISNASLLYVLCFNRNLLKAFPFIFGICVSDLIDSVAFLVTGSKRNQYTWSGIQNDPVHPFTCLLRITSFWLIALQLTSLMIALAAAERILAVLFFYWYYKRWTTKFAWFLSGIAYVYCFLSVGTAWVLVYNLPPDTTTTMSCLTTGTVGKYYGLYHFGLAIASGTASLIMTLVSLYSMLYKRRNFQKGNDAELKEFVKRQLEITISMVAVAFFDFTCVCLPSLFTYLVSYFPFLQVFSLYGTAMGGVRAILSIFIYFGLNSKFKTCLLKSVGWKTNTVQVISLPQNQE